jgi:prevent-host-death family protein
MTAWKMETAKARLSEVVRQAQVHGPQRITIRGVAAAVVLSHEDYAQLTRTSDANWVDTFRQRFTGDIDLRRDDDTGRDFSL